MEYEGKKPKTKPKLKNPQPPKTTHHNPNLPKPTITTAPAPGFSVCLDEPFTRWEITKAILYQEPAKAEYLRKEGIFVR